MEQNFEDVKDDLQIKKEYYKEFLIADFKQSMHMLRHYDKVHWDIVKFCFSQIVVIIGACWCIHADVDEENQIFHLFGINVYILPMLLGLSALFTFFSLIAICKNREYFCKISHYINEQRNIVLEARPLGFRNEAGMWHDVNYPKTRDWKSTQLISIYVFLICSFLQVEAAVYLSSLQSCSVCWCILTAVLFCILVFIGSKLFLKDNI